jgi:hypothetical protein
MPFQTVRKVASQAEKDRLIEEQRKLWNESAGMQHLICADEETFLSNFASAIEVELPIFKPARPLTTAERTQQDGELMFLRIFGDRASDPYDGLPDVLRQVAKAQDDEALTKLVAPAKRSETFIENLVREALAKVVEKRGHVRSEHDRDHLAILPKLAVEADTILDDRAVNKAAGLRLSEEDAMSLAVAKFVKAHLGGDEHTMRVIARTLVEAA